jgi:hypothetical protein
VSYYPRRLTREGGENLPRRHRFLVFRPILIDESRGLFRRCFSALGRDWYGLEGSLCTIVGIHTYEITGLPSVWEHKRGWALYQICHHSC